MKKIFYFVLLTPFLFSCNLYSPFKGDPSDEEAHLEEAEKCLHENNYDCAITQYNALPDGETKEEKLCEVYLSQGGVTLSSLVNIITENSGTMLGGLAQSLVPWTQAKSDALDNAKTHCVTNYPAVATNSGNVTLLKALAYYSHCAIRIAKTDLYVATSNGDTSCSTASSNNDGVITRSDIGPASGSLAAGNGMCPADVTTCNSDLSTAASLNFTSAGLTDINSANSAIPADAKTDGTAVITVRAALRSTISAR